MRSDSDTWADDVLPALVWRTDAAGAHDRFNAAWLRFTGRTAADEAGAGWTTGLHPEDAEARRRLFDEAFAGRAPFTAEYRLRRQDGAYRWMLDSAAPVEDSEGRFAGYAGVAVDVTEAKEAEARARQAADDKEQALRELHHRVRNNMQLVSSLLNMQASMVADPTVRQYLTEAQQRVLLLARVQQQLYENEPVRSLSFGRFLRKLCEDLARSLQGEATRYRIETEADDQQMPADQVVLLALIVNELVSNAMKYAYAGRAEGTIRVRFGAAPEGGFHLSVADEGVGLPEGFEPTRSRTLGMVLVTALSRQLDARLDIDRTPPGVTFALTRPSGA